MPRRTRYNTAWYAPGPRPGQRGNAVIAGHVDYPGIGPVVFWTAQRSCAGDEIFVTDDQGVRRRFVVTAVEIYLAEARAAGTHLRRDRPTPT